VSKSSRLEKSGGASEGQAVAGATRISLNFLFSG
jgi:hypothetical protein